VDAALTMQFLPAPVTGFAGISKLAAGEQLVLTRAGATTRRYWTFAFRHGEMPASPEEAGRELERRLTAAVASHMTADVPVGVYLSGGIDSSLTAALATRTSSARLQSFSLVFPDDPNLDERRYSRVMAQAIGSEHHELEFRAAMMPDLVDDMVLALEEPAVTSPAILFFTLSRLASRHVKAVLTGEGADELFAGYTLFRRARPYRWRRRLPPWLRVLGGGVLRPAAEWRGSARYTTIGRFLAAPDDAHADLELRRVFERSQKRRLLGAGRAAPDLEPFLLPAVTAASCRNDLERLLATDLVRRLGDGILVTAEKMTMAHALEQRMPFLDPSIVAFAEGLESNLKLRAGKEKFILTQLGHLLPPEIVAREKQGLRHPATGRSPAMLRLLRERLLGEGRLFREPMVRRELNQVAAGSPAAGPRAWTLLVVQCWWDRFFT
jgi:asparagine synthase (glutamine-hydrolysing)